MRVVGGIWKGRSLSTPADGTITRPTSDRNREALASMILSAFELSLENVCVLDAFAGSGALGIEMLSRGASFCSFIEKNQKIAALVKNNLKELGTAHTSYELICKDAFATPSELARRTRTYKLVLLDPPYAVEAERVGEFVCELFSKGVLCSGAIVVYEHALGAPTLGLSSAKLLRTKEHASSAFDLFRMEA